MFYNNILGLKSIDHHHLIQITEDEIIFDFIRICLGLGYYLALVRICPTTTFVIFRKLSK